MNILFFQVESDDFIHSLAAVLEMQIFLPVFLELKDGFAEEISVFVNGKCDFL